MSKKIGSGVKTDYVVRTYKGFNYSYVWYNNKKQQGGGSMRYIIEVPKDISRNNKLYQDSYMVRSLFDKFIYAKDMKKAIDTFIINYPHHERF
tara:strand:- start:260 stop:538 length:279 start_codon:yes stop_codon:yes gene_type:complete